MLGVIITPKNNKFVSDLMQRRGRIRENKYVCNTFTESNTRIKLDRRNLSRYSKYFLSNIYQLIDNLFRMYRLSKEYWHEWIKKKLICSKII